MDSNNNNHSSLQEGYLTFFKNVCLISGAFACDLLLLILVPPFGWFIFAVCVSVLVWLLYGSYQVILKHFQEILRLVSESASQAFHIFCDWFREGPLIPIVANGSPV
uniref:Uncharacterized protein n=1 Tax=Quercus lobata TaxID=97700 RepID=A0A7N2L9Y8_QUELO